MNVNNPSATLSVCMIVRDEEHFLAGCLESVRDIAHQIVIVDTGSADATLKIAAQFQAEIYHFTWCDDFARARNESLKHANGDWILWLDADERLMKSSAPILRDLLREEAKPVVYSINIRNRTGDSHILSLTTADRLFTNHKGIRFSGLVHEQVLPALKKLQGVHRKSDVFIDHLGYQLDPERQSRKLIRNRALLEKYVKQQPNSAYAHFTLAQHLDISGQLTEAYEHYLQALQLDQFRSELKTVLYNALMDNCLRRGYFDKARSYGRLSLERNASQCMAPYLFYKIAFRENNYPDAIIWLEKLLLQPDEKNPAQAVLPSDLALDRRQILNTLGVMNFSCDRFVRALGYFEQVYKAGDKTADLLKKLVETCMRCNRTDLVERYLTDLIEIEPEKTNHQFLLATVLIKQKRFTEAIRLYENLLPISPESELILKRLAGLYGTIGDLARARELCLILQNQNSPNQYQS